METRVRLRLCESPAPRCSNLSRGTPALVSRWLENSSTAITGMLPVSVSRVGTSCYTGQCHSETGCYPARSLGWGWTKQILNISRRKGSSGQLVLNLPVYSQGGLGAGPALSDSSGPTVNCMVVPKRYAQLESVLCPY